MTLISDYKFCVETARVRTNSEEQSLEKLSRLTSQIKEYRQLLLTQSYFIIKKTIYLYKMLHCFDP